MIDKLKTVKPFHPVSHRQLSEFLFKIFFHVDHFFKSLLNVIILFPFYALVFLAARHVGS